MKALFITRKFPPQVGGMERHAFGLYNNLDCEKYLIALKKSQIHLIWFVPYAFFKSLFIAHKFDLIYVSDGVLAPIAWALKVFTRKPIGATIHGLEVTYKNPIFKLVNRPAMKKLDFVTTVSKETKTNCITAGIDEQKISIIPNGIEKDFFAFDFSDDEKRLALESLSKKLNRDLKSKTILLTVGRLVKRKGVAWFIDNVLPKLGDNFIYLVIGDGTDRENIQDAISKHKLEDKVVLCGRVDDETRNEAYRVADIFLMPNIKVEGDQEGFGITAIEAALAGLTVVASDIEGLKDAVLDNETGFLIESENADKYINKINSLSSDPEKTRIFGRNASDKVANLYDWKKIASRYIEVFKKHAQN